MLDILKKPDMKSVFFYLIALNAFITTNFIYAQCSTEVIIIQGVECKLPKVTSNNTILLPCTDTFNISGAPVGTKFNIDFIPSNCISICQQGLMVDITCAHIITKVIEPEEEETTVYTDVSGNNLIVLSTKATAIQIIDLSGKIILSQKKNIQSVDISGIVPGIYLARLISSSESETFKFIKTGN